MLRINVNDITDEQKLIVVMINSAKTRIEYEKKIFIEIPVYIIEKIY